MVSYCVIFVDQATKTAFNLGIILTVVTILSLVI